jgi:hypothetical protein
MGDITAKAASVLTCLNGVRCTSQPPFAPARSICVNTQGNSNHMSIASSRRASYMARSMTCAIAVATMLANAGASNANVLAISESARMAASRSGVIEVLHRRGSGRTIVTGIARRPIRAPLTTQYYFPPPSGYAPYPAYPYYYPPYYVVFPNDFYQNSHPHRSYW